MSETTKPKIDVWSCGGGAQSAGIAALIIQGLLPKPDVSVIADTGREMSSTWKYLDEVLNPNLASVGIEIKRITALEWGYYHKTGHEVFNSQGTLMIPIYTDQTGEVAKFSSFCSSHWKQEPVDRWLRSIGIEKSNARKWLGYGREEQKRWTRCMLSEDFKRDLISLPLVQIMPMNRHECQQLISKMGWPKAPKSRCWMCPNQRDEEWLELTAEELQAAIQFERDMQKKDPNAWLHKSCKPLDQVVFSRTPDLLSNVCHDGGCFT